MRAELEDEFERRRRVDATTRETLERELERYTEKYSSAEQRHQERMAEILAREHATQEELRGRMREMEASQRERERELVEGAKRECRKMELEPLQENIRILRETAERAARR